MKRHVAIYAGTIAFVLATGAPVFSEVSIRADATEPDKRTDLTGGQGIPSEYSDTPVRQGKLIEVKDSQYINAPVYSSEGKDIGKIKEVLKDQETGNIEYVVFILKESKRAMPLRRSQFETKSDKLQLNLKKEDIVNDVRMSSSKDLSPDMKQYMDRVNAARTDPSVPGQHPGVPGQKGPLATGELGEDSVGGGGPSGTSGLPPGKAPGFEGGNPSSKR